MRVLHIITRLIVGGAQENTVASVIGLRELHGIEARLVSGPTTGPEGSIEHLFDRLPGTLEIAPNLLREISAPHDYRAFRQLLEIIRRDRPDIVHTHSGKAGILGRLAAKAAGVPCIIHGIHGPSFGPFQGVVANLIFTTAERIAGRVTDHFVSVADAMSRQYLAAGIGAPEKYSTIYSGFDLEPFQNCRNSLSLRKKLGLRPDAFVVGKIARLFELKGHEDLLDAAPAIVAKDPRVQFLFVGDGDLRSTLQDRIRALGLEAHFVFAGLVPPSAVPDYVGVMNAVVHLSHREGLPRALAQALAGGRPIISYNLDGAPEVCINEQTGFLVQPHDVAGLQSAIQRLAGSPELAEQLGRTGQEMVRERFSTRVMVDSLAALYGRLLRKGQ